MMIIYTSGTTGRPKGAVHVHGGFLVKIAQEVAHQADMHADDVLHWVTDLGWIMGPWELVGGLAAGGTVVLAEGVPDYPAPDRLWSMVERHGITILGVSPTLVRALIKHGVEPVRSHDLSRLRILASTGEPWDPESWRWLFEEVGGGRLPIINITGGTEVGACLLSAFPITPLKPCSLVGPSLGMAVDVYDPDGRPLAGQGVGELVCTRPWPAMTRGSGRPRALPGDLLVAMAGCLGPRRLGLDRRRRRLVPPRPQRRHDQGGRQAARPGRGRVDPQRP